MRALILAVLGMMPVRPNILLIIADDHRAGEMGAFGSPAITPHLDGLARDGAAFTHAFTTVPICQPARAELLTGCHAFRARVPWFGMPTAPELPLLPRVLRNAGYDTYHVGKWHNDGHPRDRGYDVTRRVFPSDSRAPLHTHELRFEEDGGEAAGFSSALFADAAIECLQRGRSEQPWFLFLGFYSPHDPRTPPPEFATLYDPAGLDLPANFMPEHPFDNGAMAIRDELLEKWPRTPAAVRRHLADYYGMISEMDAQIGRVLKALDETGQREDTIVVYMSDHGLAIGSHGLLGKENMYDHSVRIPLIFQGPGVAPGRHAGLCYGYDVYATLCELAGVRVSWEIDGRSLGEALAGRAWRGRPEICGAFIEAQRMIRDERWKLIHYPQNGFAQLFDLQSDPAETSNLLESWRYREFGYREATYYVPEHDGRAFLEKARELHGRLEAWQRAAGDPLAGELRRPGMISALRPI